jgi:hypothetical protein
MDLDHPERDQIWDEAARSETEMQRLDRNWTSLLQELRVTQTGVQLLTGFLLTVPFEPRFDKLSAALRVVYLATVGCSISSTVLLVAPVAMHRLLFRRHRMETIVATAHRFAYSGLLLLGLALAGVTVVIFGSVAGHAAGIIAGVCAAIALVGFWIAFPLAERITRVRSATAPHIQSP